MAAEFDPYHKWLGIPPKLQPPNHYRLLGVEPFESDLDVIDAAANQRMAYLQGLASGEHGELSQTLLNELAMARVCLMDPADKEAYDAELRRQIESSGEPTKRAESDAQPATTEGTAGEVKAQIESLPADDDPAPPPVAAAPPVAITEPDAAPPAKPKPPAAPPAVRLPASQGEAAASAKPPKPAAPPKKTPPVQAKPTPAGVATVVSLPGDRPGSRARQMRRKRGSPVLIAVGSVAAILVLLAVIYFATGQWKDGRPSGSSVSQSASDGVPRPKRSAKPRQPTAKDKADGGSTADASTDSAGRSMLPDDDFVASGPVGDAIAGKPELPDESPLNGEVPFDEALAAITNGQLERALPLLERVLKSSDSRQRTWARQMLEEVDIATSDHAAKDSLEQLSDENLELFVKGKIDVNARADRFSYPALHERFGQTLKKNAPAELERRRADRAEAMAAPADGPLGDAALRVENVPAKPEAKPEPKRPPVDPASNPAEFLQSRGLRKNEGFWLLEGDDGLRKAVTHVDDLARASRAADTALLKAIDMVREGGNQVAVAKQTGRIGIVEEAQRRFNNMKREYREVAAKSMKARSDLIIASLQAARWAEEATGKYRELADDPDVQKALKQLGLEAGQLGPTPALERNLERIQRNDARLLTDQIMGFFGGEKEDIFHANVIVNDRASALFALQPRAEFSLVPEQVLREAGIPYDAEWKLEKKANGVEFRTNPVVIPSLRLGRFVSTNIEAFILPADIRNLKGILAENAFPNFRIDVQPGENVARLRAVR